MMRRMRRWLSGALCAVFLLGLLPGAALAAEGESRIADSGYIKRGYEDICRDLRMLGADVREIGSGEETAAEGKRYR